jgi:hypothetical protein
MEKEIEIWYSEYELRQFIYMAFRWKIEGVYNNRTENRPFSEFTHFVENARDNFELFRTQLNKKLTKTENWKAIEIDLKHRFLPMIDGYLNWYEQNKAELVKFEPYCPYTIMLSIIESTKAEILKYFPQNNKPLPPEQTETKTDKLKVPQIALIHVYEDIQITEDNAKEIAAKYGYMSKTSGKGLYHDYLKYCKTSDRKAKPTAETKITLINKIKLFESVVIYLSDNKKQRATDEIKILKTIFEKEYQ